MLEPIRPSALHTPGISVAGSPFAKIPPDIRRYFRSGNRVLPLFGAHAKEEHDTGGLAEDVFTRTVKDLRGARRSIQVEMFELDSPKLLALLAEKARNGVTVQVIADPPPADRDDPRSTALRGLRESSVDLRFYPTRTDDPTNEPLAPTEEISGSRVRIDHVKLVIVDGTRAIIGGMNWGTHSPLNHDFDVAIEGPAVRSMGWLFNEDWLSSGAPFESTLPLSHPAPCGEDLVNLVVTADDPHERTIAHTVLRAIRNARQSIHAELFALTESRTLQALIEAHRRGLEVKIILDPLRVGHSAINETACTRLREAGVEVRWYTCDRPSDEMMHGKLGLFDDDQTVVGSANWTTSGFNTNREAAVEVLSPTVNATFERQFQADWHSRSSIDPIYLPSTPWAALPSATFPHTAKKAHHPSAREASTSHPSFISLTAEQS